MIWNSVNNFTLTAIPLFVFMGEMVLHGGLSQRFYRGMGLLFSRVPGRLLQANIASCAIFAAVTGVSVATAATVGTVAVPELSKRGYNREMIFGSLAGGGTLGILIPPSVPFIIYGVMAQESITDLFAAGIIPGIVLTLIFMIYVAIRVLVTPRLVPDKSLEVSLSAKEKVFAFSSCSSCFWPHLSRPRRDLFGHHDTHRGSRCGSIRFHPIECLLREAQHR